MINVFSYAVVAVLMLGASCQDPKPNIEQEVTELLEMVPFEKVISLAMEYAINDQQVNSLLGYLSSPKFKENIVSLEKTEEFSELADVAELYSIDAYSIANKINRALELPLVSSELHRQYRRRRSPGEGVAALVREAVANIPLEEIKEAYKYKYDTNPQFKSLMERVLSGDVKQYIQPLLDSAPFLETKKDLQAIGLPLTEIQEFLEKTSTEFFDLESQMVPTPDAR